MKEERDNTSRDNIYRDQSVCPVGHNDFDFLKENKITQTL
jgi:hypothetical protein